MAQDVLGFATRATKSNPSPVVYSKGTQKNINAIQKNAAGPLSGVIGQGPDASYQKFVQQQQQTQKAAQTQVKVQQQAQQQKQAQAHSLIGRLKSGATDVGNATKAIVRPVTDVVTGKGGKAAHDTAQLSQDVTGGAPNYLLKADIVDPAKELLAKTPQQKQAAIQQSNEDLGLGKSGKDIKSGLKKAGAEAVLTGTLAAGGGEAAGAKSLLAKGVKVAGKQVAKDAAIGSAGNAAATVATNPKASLKEVGKSAAVGGLIGGIAPHAIKAGGDVARAGVDKVANTDNKIVSNVKAAASSSAPAKSLIQNQHVKSLIEAGQKQQEAEEPPLQMKAQVNPEHVKQGLITPQVHQTPVNKLSIPAESVSKLDSQKVGQYVKQIKDGEPIEPIVTHELNGVTHVVDGQHRLAAAQKLGITEVPTVEKVPGATPLAPVSTAIENPTKSEAGSPVSAEPKAPAEPTAPAKNNPSVSLPDNTAKLETSPTKPQTNEPIPQSEKPPATQPAAVSTPATTKAVVDPNAPPETGTSKIAQDIQTKAVAKNLSDNYGEMTQYNKINVANEADKAVKFVNGDKDTLDKVISGEKPLPSDLRATAVVKAVEEHPEYGKDPEVLKSLAKSPLNAESSRSAQELRLAAERDTNSPVARIQELGKARQDAFQKRSGKTAAKATNDEVRQIRESVPKVKNTKETFESFVDSLKC